MPGTYQYDVEIKSNVAKLLSDMKQVQDRLDTVEGKEYKIKLNVDEKKLSNVISNLEKMLDSLGKGTGDFKQFENLSKQLFSITTDIGKISKAFATMDDGSGLVNNIKSIDTSLTNLANHFVSQVSDKMTSSIKEVKGTLSDVGNGKELTPLLDTIGRIESAIDKLSSSVKGIGLNMNIDFGSDKEMEAKAEAKISNALQAYQRLFDHIKMSSAGGSIINTKFFDFDIDQYDTAMSKLQAYRKFIDNIRKETKSQFNGKDVLYEDTDKKYWTQASSAMGQVTKVFNEMKAASDTNPLENIFGKTDLTEVLNQLTAIVSKLDEISVSANSFADVFKNGLNVNASVEEINKLTNRVKELESELGKIKTPVVTGNESNLSLENNQRKDAFPKTSENLEQVAKSEQKVQQEAVATDKALDNISFTPNTEGFDDIIAKFGILREQAEQITKIVKTTKQTADGTPNISYKATLRNGSSYYLGENSTPQVLNASETVYDAKAVAKNAEQEAKAIQAEWDKNIKAIQDYMDAMTKLNNLKAKDKGTGSEANQIALQTQNVEELKQVAWDARKNLSSMQAENPDIIAWKQWVDMMELFDQASKGSAESAAKLKDVLNNIKVPSLDKYENKLASYQTKKAGYDATIARFNDGGWTSDEYLKNVQAVKDAVKKYEDLLSNIKAKGGITSEEDIQHLKEYESEIKNTISTVTNMSASEKGYNFVSGQKELDKIHKLLAENSKMSSEAKAKIRAYYAEIESGNPSMSLDKIHGEIMKIYNAEVEAGRVGRSFFDTLKNSGFHQLAAQMAGMFGVYDVINLGKEGFNVVRKLNTALTEMRKVSDETVQNLKDYQATTFDTADAVGTTAKQIQNSTADWMRLGESMNQAAESAKDANVLLNVSEFEGIDEATESLVSMSQAYKDLDKMDIIDVLNNIGNNYSISTDGLATALKDSASALVTANNDLNEAVSLTTAGNAITQDPSKVGAGLRTISLRLVGKQYMPKHTVMYGSFTTLVSNYIG